MQASKILFILGLAGLAKSLPIDEVDKWEIFKLTHGKTYESTTEEMYRKSIFDKNIAKINEHNKLFLSGLESYSMGVNQFTDKLMEEVTGNGFKRTDTSHRYFRNVYIPNENVSIPTETDWRTVKGVVTPVVNKGTCVSGWAFSVTGAIEGQLMLRKNISVTLSAQNLMDCNGMNTCDRGGFAPDQFLTIMGNGGVETEEDYPYIGRGQKCKADDEKVVYTIAGATQTEEGNEQALTSAIANVGPISISLCVSYKLLNYREGIFYDPVCHCEMHTTFKVWGMLAVGYGTEGGRDYYIVRTSFGTTWGEKGYIRMARNKKNMCKIADLGFYPTF